MTIASFRNAPFARVHDSHEQYALVENYDPCRCVGVVLSHEATVIEDTRANPVYRLRNDKPLVTSKDDEYFRWFVATAGVPSGAAQAVITTWNVVSSRG